MNDVFRNRVEITEIHLFITHVCVYIYTISARPIQKTGMNNKRLSIPCLRYAGQTGISRIRDMTCTRFLIKRTSWRMHIHTTRLTETQQTFIICSSRRYDVVTRRLERNIINICVRSHVVRHVTLHAYEFWRGS